ncbi:hypothetical protein C8F04DRAFT_1128042 [Mycena alexandri]|uniref:Uncharacterized protein n=1 Tax=Mycena alexandri TaxID=1745969 RepID=A0AAD6SDG0_9AGAR|nr:hypothetical protein C8F04DRAFT_1128042 [Mycena alexandri]
MTVTRRVALLVLARHSLLKIFSDSDHRFHKDFKPLTAQRAKGWGLTGLYPPAPSTTALTGSLVPFLWGLSSWVAGGTVGVSGIFRSNTLFDWVDSRERVLHGEDASSFIPCIIDDFVFFQLSSRPFSLSCRFVGMERQLTAVEEFPSSSI